MSVVKLYYPELLIRYEDIEMEVLGKTVKFDRSEEDEDLGDFMLPIFLSREECEQHYPNEKIGVMMFGVYEN